MTDEELQLRRWAVCASGLVYWGGVWFQARRVRRQIGRSPNLKPRGGREKSLWLGWFLVIATWVGQPLFVGQAASTPAVALWPGLVHPMGLVAGLALLSLGYAGTLWTYAAMGDTWRIGINPGEKTTLIRRGPYRWVRHPIYSLQMVMLTGAALLLPTPVSFAILVAHCLCVLIKAGDEEKYLLTVHGDAYQEFLLGTGQLFPKLIRGRTASGKGRAGGIDS